MAAATGDEGSAGDALRATLSALAIVLDDAHGEVHEALLGAATSQDYARIRDELTALAASSDEVTAGLRSLVNTVERAAAEWAAAHRYEDDGLEELARELERIRERRPSDAARRWLHEIFDAIRASELDAAVRIAELWLDLGSALERGRESVRERVRRLRDGDPTAGLELMRTIAAGEVPSWERVLDVTVRSRAHRLAALYAVRTANDTEAARTHLDAAVNLDGRESLNYVERSAFWLFLGDLDRAAEDAQHAIDLAEGEPAAYLMLGLWAELNGEFEEAEGLYQQAMERMTLHAVAAIARRASLIDPPGLMLAVAGEHLLELGRPHAALQLAEAAAATGVRGRARYADARVHRLRGRALADLPDRAGEAAQAFVEAGKRSIWNGDPAVAVVDLRRALSGEGDLREAHWLLADALVTISFPPGEAVADPALLREARQHWDAAAASGPPDAGESWAYVTRAIMTDLESQHTPDERPQGRWLAVLDCERALVHDSTDAVRWGFAGRYLRGLGLDELAFEVVERGYALNDGEPSVLYQRLALLANRGAFAEASAVARDLVASVGEDPWVVGVQAWLALHEERYEEALTLLDLPLSQGYDLSWYLDLRGVCHLALDELEAGRGDYRAILAGVSGGSIPITEQAVKLMAAVAEALVGDTARARAWLADTVPEMGVGDDVSFAAVTALVSIAEGRLDVAEEDLESAVEATVTPRDLADLFAHLPMRLRALDPELKRAGEALVRRVYEQLGPARREALEATITPSPEAELVREGPAAPEELRPLVDVVMLAIGARRLATTDPEASTERYEQLRGTLFEPEATLALTRALQDVTASAVASGDAEAAREAQHRLVELGAADPVDAALAVASALRTAGHAQEAQGELAAAASGPVEEAKLDLLEQNLGELELIGDDPDSASEHFETALELVRDGDDPARVGQLETRAALAKLVAGRSAEAQAHIRNALAAWSKAGAFEAPWTIVQEARSIVAQSAESEHIARALDALAGLVGWPTKTTEAPPED